MKFNVFLWTAAQNRLFFFKKKFRLQCFPLSLSVPLTFSLPLSGKGSPRTLGPLFMYFLKQGLWYPRPYSGSAQSQRKTKPLTLELLALLPPPPEGWVYTVCPVYAVLGIEPGTSCMLG